MVVLIRKVTDIAFFFRYLIINSYRGGPEVSILDFLSPGDVGAHQNK
jgi:hypothetical protein